MILDETLKLIKENLNELDVKTTGVAVGLFYSGVVFQFNRCLYGGVAYVFRELCPPTFKAGILHELNPFTLAELSLSPNLVEASVGVASLNALSQIIMEKNHKYEKFSIDVADLVRKDESVVMVGYMEPVIKKLLEKTRRIIVSETKQLTRTIVRVVPSSDAVEHLTTADVVIITGSTLVNKTIDEILRLDLKAREVAVVGPTASILPNVLFDHGVTAVMGVEVTDPNKMLQIICQGGGTRQLLLSCAQKKAYLKRK